MTEPGPPPSLDELDARLKKARGEAAGRLRPADADGTGQNALGMAFRVGVELVAGLVVGVGIGLLLDEWLGTAPWGMIAFFFLGAGAGIMNVYRAVNRMGVAPGYRRPDVDPDRDPENDDPGGDEDDTRDAGNGNKG